MMHHVGGRHGASSSTGKSSKSPEELAVFKLARLGVSGASDEKSEIKTSMLSGFDGRINWCAVRSISFEYILRGKNTFQGKQKVSS